jgi:hypothetical protein
MVKSTSEDPTEEITKVTPLGEGSVDRKNAGLLMLAPRSGQSDSKKASKVSLTWKRWNGVPIGKTFANALSFMTRSALERALRILILYNMFI